jgi:hypothetical protein
MVWLAAYFVSKILAQGGKHKMMKRLAICISMSAVMLSGSALWAQTTPAKAPAKTAAKPETPQELNTEAYVKLLRENVGAEKAKLMGAVMQLDAEDAAKFWPVYRDYDVELTKVNDLRVANLQEYERNYTQMTDEKADELIKRGMDYQKQRAELLAKYYELMKQQVGAVTAARFVQVENQLLLIIDLEINSSLPVVGS